jgi:hypothetical protein
MHAIIGQRRREALPRIRPKRFDQMTETTAYLMLLFRRSKVRLALRH